MTYYLYADVFFAVNFAMDFLLLSILRKILKAHATVFRILCASAVGAGWSLFAVVFPILPKALESLVTYGGVSCLMVKIAFSTKGWRETGRAVLNLYVTAATAGGLMYALYQHTRAGYYIEQLLNGNAAEAMPVYIFILLAAGTYFGTKFLWMHMMEWKKRQNHMYRVTLNYKNRMETVFALMDTGNHLYEPVTHKPVHILTGEAAMRLCNQIDGVIYVPFQSVGTGNGLLPAIYLDSMEVEQNGEKQYVEKPLVAIYKGRLSPSEEYQMLLHEEL